MSVGLNRSFQYAGLNRCGVYWQTAKEKGPERADRSVGATTEKPNEIWRRITGIFPQVEMTPKQRRLGLKLLVRRIRERVRRELDSSTPHPGLASLVSALSLKGRGENGGEQHGENGGEQHGENGNGEQHGVTGRDARTTGLAASERRASGSVELSLVVDWDFEAENWARARTFGISVEQICAELGCGRNVLTALMKEYCGVSAAEFLDGLKISRLRAGLVARLREAAWGLWGAPGSFAVVKICAEVDSTRRTDGTGEGGKGRKGEKRSRYFRSGVEEMFGETRAEERARRVAELCEALRGGTGGRATSGTLGTRFELESWAVSCGFESGAKLRRACLNVFGRTLAEVERGLAAEVVQFYLCAEDRELRAIACSDRLSVEVARAREIYHGDEAKPVPPFEDEWAKFEELKAEWLARMGDAFG